MRKSSLFCYVLFLLCISSPFGAKAADDEPKKFDLLGDASLRVARGQFGGGLAVWGLWNLGKSKKFSVGLGLRHSTHIGTNLEYSTAPAKFTKDEKMVDTMVLKNSSVTSFNIAIDLRYRIVKQISVGFNIDAIGFSFGAEQDGALAAEGDIYTTRAKPTLANVLLVGDNDIGTLNSELYLIYHATDKLGIKAGISHLFTEYTTDKKYIPEIDNDRYRNKSTSGVIGIQYRF